MHTETPHTINPIAQWLVISTYYTIAPITGEAPVQLDSPQAGIAGSDRKCRL